VQLVATRLCFRQRDVENLFTPAHTFQQELQREGRLAGSGIALDQIKAVTRQAARQNIVEALNPAYATRMVNWLDVGFRHNLVGS
jgi:hypothetical protein